MAYFQPYIDQTGIHVPTYEDIRDDLLSSMRQIFGTDIYLGEDTQDYQQISIFAKKIYDTNSLAVLIYNNRTANTAIGIGLDNLCALVGITRKPATYSSVVVTLNGAAGTVIQEGKVSDGTNVWNLPDEVTIPDNGIITVNATSDVPGSVTALPNTITTIVTPVYGWYGVTNQYTAQSGSDQETDASLRGRYAESTLAPAVSIFESITSSIEQINGVTRVKGYENDSGSTSSEGFPPHSVTYVVEGGDDTQIATEIYYKKTPGTYTNGTTNVELTSTYGNVSNIRFYRPTYNQIYVKIKLKKLAGYNSNYESEIKESITNYINGLQIAETVYRSIVWSVATSVMSSLIQPEFAITDVQLSTNGSSFSANDIIQSFNNAAATSVNNITIEVS